MKLLLVDDDKIILDTMPSAFPWADWGIRTVRTAWSIRQARRILKEEQIDILLCDIEMPLGTGIELIEWMRDEIPAPVVTILLTCHSEFQYARRALQLGCSNYLLKPPEETELKKAILEAEERVIGLRKQEREQKRREEKARNMDAFWETLMVRHADSGESLRRICEEYEIPESLHILPVLVSVSHHSFRVRDVSRSLMSFVLENVLRETLQGEKFGLVNHYDEKLMLFFEKEEPGEDGMGGLSDPFLQVADWMEENYHCVLSCYFGKVSSLDGWEKEYGFLRQAEGRFVGGVRLYPASLVRHIHFMPFALPGAVRSGFLGLFASGKHAELLAKMQDYFSSLSPEQCDAPSLDAAMRRLDQELERELEAGEAERFRRLQEQLLKENPDYLRSIPGLLEYYGRILEGLSRRDEETEPESVICRVKQYISMNMNKELGRDEVAARVGLHPDYLNRIFKKETGVSLKEYIADAKTRMTCELLEQTDFTVGEIGEMVGYVNFSSFTTFFRKRTGLTPTAWRKEHTQ